VNAAGASEVLHLRLLLLLLLGDGSSCWCLTADHLLLLLDELAECDCQKLPATW
jgi:hypothetical protein